MLLFRMVVFLGRIVGQSKHHRWASSGNSLVAAIRIKLEKLFILALIISMFSAVSGCARWRLPAIDPSGERIFLPHPNYTTINPNDGYPQGIPSNSRLGRTLGVPGPVFEGADTPPDCPEDLTSPNRATANIQASSDSRGYATPPAVPRLMVPGCFQRPDGRRFDLLNQGEEYEGNVVLKPRRVIAPVGSEVVIVGGVCDGEGYYKTREPIEWALEEGSVGTFTEPGAVSQGPFGYRRPLGGLFSEIAPELLSNNYAIGCTSKKVQVLTRGTSTPVDDIFVLNGQGWIGLTSAQEGASYVTLFAPNLEASTGRQASSVVHWIDGEWTLPPPVISRDGTPQTLTTTVRRKITKDPIAGWIVRYEIVGGAPAFLDGDSTTREVTTDLQGNASVQIVPDGAQTGTTQIKIQVIRPASGRGEPDRLVIGQGFTEVTWNTANIELTVSGPESVDAGEEVNYRIEVFNPGNIAVSDVSVRSMIPPGFDYVASSPEGRVFGGYVEWDFPSIDAGQRATMDAIYRAGQDGTARHCVTARTPAAPSVEDCISTVVTQNSLFIDMRGPSPDSVLEVGEIANYKIRIVNRGDRRLTDIEVVDRFDPGIRQRTLSGDAREDQTDSVRQIIPELGPGEEDVFELNFVVVSPGRLCHTLTATAVGTKPAETTACFTAIEPAVREYQVRLDGPRQMSVGDQDIFSVEVENTGEQPLSNLQIIVGFPEELVPTRADPPTSADSAGRVSWFVNGPIPPGGRLPASYQVMCEARFATESAVCELVVQSDDGMQRSDSVQLVVAPRLADDDEFDEAPPRVLDDFNDDDRGGAFDPGNTNDSIERDPEYDELSDDLRTDESNTTDDTSTHLELRIDSRTERRQVGDQDEITLIYIIEITNNDDVYDRDVKLTVQLPREISLEKYTGPTAVGNNSADWRILQMNPVRALRPNESISYEIRTRVDEPGEIVTLAEVSSLQHPNLISRENSTLVAP